MCVSQNFFSSIYDSAWLYFVSFVCDAVVFVSLIIVYSFFDPCGNIKMYLFSQVRPRFRLPCVANIVMLDCTRSLVDDF